MILACPRLVAVGGLGGVWVQRIQEMPNFFADLEQGTLPQFSLLEPRMATSATGPSNWQVGDAVAAPPRAHAAGAACLPVQHINGSCRSARDARNRAAHHARRPWRRMVCSRGGVSRPLARTGSGRHLHRYRSRERPTRLRADPIQRRHPLRAAWLSLLLHGATTRETWGARRCLPPSRRPRWARLLAAPSSPARRRPSSTSSC